VITSNEREDSVDQLGAKPPHDTYCDTKLVVSGTPRFNDAAGPHTSFTERYQMSPRLMSAELSAAQQAVAADFRNDPKGKRHELGSH
jgi:hypothetical protein